MTSAKGAQSLRIVYSYRGDNIAARYEGPVPRVGERVNIQQSAFRNTPEDDVQRFRVTDVLYQVDGGPDPEDTGMLVRVSLTEAEEQEWYTD